MTQEFRSFEPKIDHGIEGQEQVPAVEATQQQESQEKLTPDSPFSKEDLKKADGILNYIGEGGNVLSYISEGADRATVRGLMEEYASTTEIERRHEIAKEISRIADEAYDKK